MLGIAPLLFVLLAPAPPPPVVLRHPHFPKTVEMALGFGPDAAKLSVSHLTVTFDEEGFEQMSDGGAWHLANAHFKTPIDLVIGGQEIPAGDHRLLARKVNGGDWELVLDPEGTDFTTDISESAKALKTRFSKEQPKSEHLRVDLQPSGDEIETTLYLEVHFSTYSARCLIEIP